jgi:hypothetical protein
MFKLFKKKSPIQKLYDRHKALLEEAFRLSKSNRTASDAKMAEADEVLKEIERLKGA